MLDQIFSYILGVVACCW